MGPPFLEIQALAGAFMINRGKAYPQAAKKSIIFIIIIELLIDFFFSPAAK